MRFSLQREVFLKPLAQVVNVVERRQTLPVLANLLARVEGDQLSLTGTDLEVEMVARTRVDDAPGGGAAILAGPDGVQRSVSVGEEVASGVRLAAVAFDHVTLDRGGAREDLFLDQSGAAVPAGAPGATGPGITAAPAASSGVTVPQIRQDVGFIPRIDGGRISGLVVRSQGTGEAFRRIGLRDGDVVASIGGRPVSGADDLDRIGRDLPQGGVVPLTIERGDRSVPLSITVAPPQ